MKSFSVARAYSAGIDLIERKPWTLAWWALAIAVLQILPRFFIPALMGGGDEMSGMRDVWASMGNPEALRAAGERLKAAQAVNHTPGAGLLWLLWSVFCSAILYNAAYRSVLSPDKSGFGYLRLGGAEFWQFLTLIVQFLLFCVFGVAVVLVILALTAIAKGVGAPAAGWVMAVGLLVVIVVTLWLMLRLSLGTVATFAQGKFAYFSSWGLTKGRVWRLFWTTFLTLAMIFGLYFMFFLSVLIAVVPLSALTAVAHAPGIVPVTQGPPTVPTEILTIASIGLAIWISVVSIISAILHAVTLTPWAVAYKGLSSEGDVHH